MVHGDALTWLCLNYTKAIINDEVIDVYNNGAMSRDLTYIDDLVNAVRLLIDVTPNNSPENTQNSEIRDSKSNVAAYRVVNIGNSTPVKLTDFIDAIERNTW